MRVVTGGEWKGSCWDGERPWETLTDRDRMEVHAGGGTVEGSCEPRGGGVRREPSRKAQMPRPRGRKETRGALTAETLRSEKEQNRQGRAVRTGRPPAARQGQGGRGLKATRQPAARPLNGRSHFVKELSFIS